MSSGASRSNVSQSMDEFWKSLTPILATGICWSRSVSSAFRFHRSVVLTIIRLVNSVVPEALRNESMSGLETVWSGA